MHIFKIITRKALEYSSWATAKSALLVSHLVMRGASCVHIQSESSKGLLNNCILRVALRKGRSILLTRGKRLYLRHKNIYSAHISCIVSTLQNITWILPSYYYHNIRGPMFAIYTVSRCNYWPVHIYGANTCTWVNKYTTNLIIRTTKTVHDTSPLCNFNSYVTKILHLNLSNRKIFNKTRVF